MWLTCWLSCCSFDVAIAQHSERGDTKNSLDRCSGAGPWALCWDSESEQGWGSQRWQGSCLFLGNTNVSSRRVILNTPPLLTELWQPCQVGETCAAPGQLNYRWRFVFEELQWQIQLERGGLAECKALTRSLNLLLYLLLNPQLIPSWSSLSIPAHTEGPRSASPARILQNQNCAGGESLPWD